METVMSKPAKETVHTLPEIVAEIISFIEKIEPLLPETANIQADQKRRMAKSRRGAERVIATVANLAQTHGLDSTSLHSKTMMEQMQSAQTLGPLETRLTALLKRVSDQRFFDQAEAWSSALQFWALLKRRATTNSQLAVTIADLEAFFSYRNPKVLAEKPTKLQTRAKAKLAHANTLMAHARDRVGAIDAAAAAAPAPQTPVISSPAPVVAPPATVPVTVPAPIVTSPQSVRYTNGSNGASNGVSNGASNGTALMQGNNS
jgi:hypothetical protein